MLVGLFIGMLISAIAFMLIHYWRYSWRKASQFTEKHIMELVEHSKDIMYYYQIEPTMKYRFVSQSVEVDLGKGSQQLLLEDPNYGFHITHPDDLHVIHNKLSGQLDYAKPICQRFRAMDGQYIWFEEYATPVYRNGRIIAIQGILRNINEKMLLEEKLQYQISHDSLTDVYNRGYFEEKKNAYNEQDGLAIGLLICDLDHLKYVNDYFGHQRGDAYIALAARILREVVSDRGIVARIGGDEFAVLLENINEQELVLLMNELMQACKLQSEEGPFGEGLSMSIGYARTSNAKGAMDSLYAEADAAMYQNKRNRKLKQLAKAEKIGFLNKKANG